MNTFSKCVVCDESNESSDNLLFICKKCYVSVHMLCYGCIAKKGVNWSSEWLCSPCESGLSDPICILCLKKGGALKKTTCGHWCHVICGLFTEGVAFTNIKRMEPINVSYIPASLKNQFCCFCQNAVGVCCKCSVSGCGKYMHVTCAQKNESLREEEDKKINQEDMIEFNAYCNTHKPSATSRRLSSLSVGSHFDQSVPSRDTESNENDTSEIDAATSITDFSGPANVSNASSSEYDNLIGAIYAIMNDDSNVSNENNVFSDDSFEQVSPTNSLGTFSFINYLLFSLCWMLHYCLFLIFLAQTMVI